MSRGPFSHGVAIPSSPSPYARTGSGGGGVRGGGGGPAGGSIGGSGMGGGSISSSVSSGYSGSMAHASDSAPAGWHPQQRAPAGKSYACGVRGREVEVARGALLAPSARCLQEEEEELE